jgi:predicted small lipoprotein YifL
MKRKLVLLIATVLSLALLAACGAQPSDTLPPADTQLPSDSQTQENPTSEPEEPQEDADSESTAANLAEALKLLGMDDAAAEDALGGGTENLAPDGSTLIGRIYSTEMFGETVEPATMYDDEGRVISVTIYLAGAEAEPYATQLTELYGEPGASSAGDADESGSSWQSWDTGDGTVKLFQSFGLCSLELTQEPPAEA